MIKPSILVEKLTLTVKQVTCDSKCMESCSGHANKTGVLKDEGKIHHQKVFKFSVILLLLGPSPSRGALVNGVWSLLQGHKKVQ